MRTLTTEPLSGRARKDLQDSSAQWLSKFITQMQYICNPLYKANKKQVHFIHRDEARGAGQVGEDPRPRPGLDGCSRSRSLAAEPPSSESPNTTDCDTETPATSPYHSPGHSCL